MKGRCLSTGLPREVTLSGKETETAFAPVAQTIVSAVQDVLERTPCRSWPPTWRSAASSSPGAGSLLWGMDALLAQETGMATHLAEDPIRAVALGLEATLPHLAKRQEGGAEPGPPPAGGGVRPSGSQVGPGAWGLPGRAYPAGGRGSYEASGRSAPLPAYPAGGSPFLPRNGEKEGRGKPLDPVFL